MFKPLNFMDFLYEIQFEIYHEFFGELKHREGIYTNEKQFNYMCGVSSQHTGHALYDRPSPLILKGGLWPALDRRYLG